MSRLVSRARADEDGAVLVMALSFLLLFSLIVLALLGFTDTSFIETTSLQGQSAAVYTSDGGVDAAIRYAFSNWQTNLANTRSTGSWTCPIPVATPFQLGGNATSAAVSCSSVSTTVSGASGLLPSWAILTMNGSISLRGQGTLTVGGPVKSNSTIDVQDSRGTLSVIGMVRAVVGPCPKTGKGQVISSTNDKVCGLPTLVEPDPAIAAPAAYATAVASAPSTPASIPACPAAVPKGQHRQIEFSPPAGGYLFSDADALTNLTNGKCKNTVIWFHPGAFYFKFTKGNTWQINDRTVQVIGGTPQGGWDSNPATQPAIPGACDPAQPGAQFIVGGKSQIQVSSGSMELCPAGGASTQRIALYGATSNSNGFTPGSGNILKTSNKSVVAIEGTVYAPLQTLDLDTSKVYTPVVARGLICKSVKLRGARTLGKGLVLPPGTPDVTTSMTLNSAVAGNTTVTATVTFISADSSGNPAYQINSWEVTRG